MVPLKTICYRGGIARFEIPDSWDEEYEPSGGATFYEDEPDSGTLRLNVLTFSSNGAESSAKMISGLIAKNGYQALRDGLAIAQEVKLAEENGEQLQINYWRVAVPVEPESVRIAVFSFTILADQATDASIGREIKLLEKSIRAAEFSRDEGVSGDYQHE
jgi:hypothetical protein